MMSIPVGSFTAFEGTQRLCTAPLLELLAACHQRLQEAPEASLLIFEDRTGSQVDFDLRGSVEEVQERLSSHPRYGEASSTRLRAGPGRPRLGVISREVSLLPRHWEWLEAQPGGTSAVLRRLVEEARRQVQETPTARERLDAAGRFLWVMAGSLPDFEEVTRALYAGDRVRLSSLTTAWPPDICAHLDYLLSGVTVEASQGQA
jgi:hypothetical protein